MKKLKERDRLSIDLKAYPDVKAMLNDACDATGLTSTAVTIQSLRKQLRGVMEDVRDGAERVMRKYDKKTNSSDGAEAYAKAEQVAAQIASSSRPASSAPTADSKTKQTQRRSSRQKS